MAVLRVGLTGGIGAGKSIVARRLVRNGAQLIDADQLAREVVEPGTRGLAAVVEEFGDSVLAPDGSLDRSALAAKVFQDEHARATLNGVVHPLVRERTAERLRAVPAAAVVVQDIPLLVEGGMAPSFALVIVVHAGVEERVRRLVMLRGMSDPDARARIAAQATDEQRRQVADVWLDNTGGQERIRSAVDELWRKRLRPFERALRQGRPFGIGPPRLRPWDPDWPAQAARLAARVRAATGELAAAVNHVGATAVPGLAANDVIDLQVAVTDAVATAVDAATEPLREVGFVPGRHGCFWSADPARPARVQVRRHGSPEWRFELLVRDWLRTGGEAREDYERVTSELAAQHAADPDAEAYRQATQDWLAQVTWRIEAWAQGVGWLPDG